MVPHGMHRVVGVQGLINQRVGRGSVTTVKGLGDERVGGDGIGWGGVVE